MNTVKAFHFLKHNWLQFAMAVIVTIISFVAFELHLDDFLAEIINKEFNLKIQSALQWNYLAAALSYTVFLVPFATGIGLHAYLRNYTNRVA